MNILTAIPGRKACSFIMHISEPADTLERISKLLKERDINIDSMQMHRYRSGEANLILHCQVERDRILKLVDKLENLPGIIELHRLEEK